MVSNLLRSQPLVLILASILFLGLRLVLLLTGGEAVSYSEEPFHGIIVKELLDGLKMPLRYYQADVYSGGSLLEAALGVFSFKLFGENLFALKLIPLLFSALTLLTMYGLLKRYFGLQSALAALLLFIFSPPIFAQVSLVAVGYHGEVLLPVTAMFFAFYAFLFENKNRVLFLFLFSVLAGLSLSFHLIALIAVAACILSWFILDRRSLLSPLFFWMLVGIAVGLIPCLIYNFSHGFAGLKFLITVALLHQKTNLPLWETAGRLAIKLFDLSFKNLPQSFFYFPVWEIPPKFLSYLWASLGIATALIPACRIFRAKLRGVAPDSRDLRLVPFLVYLPVFLMVYAFSSFPLLAYASFMDGRYFVSIHLVLFILIAAEVQSKEGRDIIVLVLILIGALGQGVLFFQEPWGRALRYEAYSYLSLASNWSRHMDISDGNFERFIQMGQKMAHKDRRFFYWGLSYVTRFENPQDARESLIFKKLDPEFRPYFYQAFGAAACHGDLNKPCIQKASETVPELFRPYFLAGAAWNRFFENTDFLPEEIKRAGAVDPVYHDWFFLGLGNYLYDNEEEWPRFKDKVETLDDLKKKQFFRGMGSALANTWIFEQRPLGEMEKRIPTPTDRAELAWGMGWGIRDALSEDGLRAEHWLRRLPLEDQKYALEGMKAFEKWYQIS